MIRGLLTGTVQGTLLAGVGLIGASMVAPTTERVTVAQQVEVTSATQSGAESAPRPVAPDPEPAVIPAQPAPVPEATLPEDTANVAVPPESRFNQSPGVAAPSVPDADQAPSSQDVAEPVATPTVTAPAPDTQSAAAPDPVQSAPNVAAPSEDGAPQVAVTVQTPAPQPAPQALNPSQTPPVIVMDQTPPRPALTPPAAPQTAPATETAEVTPPAVLPDPEPEVEVATPDAEAAPVTPEPAAPAVAEAPDAEDTTGGAFASVGTFRTGASTIATDTQVAALDTPAPEADTPPEDAPAETAPILVETEDTTPATIPALEAHAVPFEGPADRPVLGVVIIDSPESELDRATLLGFAMPVAFAVDASRPDAAAAVRQYREAGFEVLLYAGSLPTEGTVGELAGAFANALDIVDESVAVIDTTEGFLQQTRVALDAVLEGTKVSGHGFLAFPQGLNAGEAAARREGVPGLTVYRLLDADRESKPTIGRYLDRALFAAGQEGQVIVVGHSYQETVTALYAFQQSLRDGDPVVAPISHILREFGTD